MRSRRCWSAAERSSCSRPARSSRATSTIVRDDLLGDALRAAGFVRPSGAGKATRGWVHPSLGLGVEVVSDQLLDGNAGRDRVRLVRLPPDGSVHVLAVEDLIADRVRQYASGTAPKMLGQARALFRMYQDTDLLYLERRIRQESAGDHGIDILRD